MNETDFCRLCLIKKTQYYSNLGENAHAVNMFQSLTSMTISLDGISLEICAECFVKLQLAFECQQTFIANQNKLQQQLLESKIKSETEYVESNVQNSCYEEIAPKDPLALEESKGPIAAVRPIKFQVCQEFLKNLNCLSRSHKPVSLETKIPSTPQNRNVEIEVRSEQVHIVIVDDDEIVEEMEESKAGTDIQNETAENSSKDLPVFNEVIIHEVTVDDVISTSQLKKTDVQKQKTPCRVLRITQENFKKIFFNIEELSDIISAEDLNDLKVASSYLCCTELFYNVEELLSHLEEMSYAADKHSVRFFFNKATFPDKTPIDVKLLDTTCIICLKVVYVSQYLDHLKSHKSGYCEYCGKTLSARPSLKFHIYNHHFGSLQCEDCGILTTSVRSLKFHRNKHHLRKATYVCNICNKEFYDHGPALREHIIQKHSKVKPFHCDLCNKQCASSSKLTSHKLSHSNVSLFTCEYCGRGFKHAGNLRAHKKNVHRIHT